LIPKLSLPTRKGAQYYKAPDIDSDEDGFGDRDNQIDDLLNDDDESELPSKFSSDDYIDEAVSNEKDFLTQIPSDPNVSYFQPTARLLSKIGRKISVSKSALTHRLGNMIGLKVEKIDEKPNSSENPLTSLSLPEGDLEENLQTRIRNNPLFAKRVSLAFAPIASNNDKVNKLEKVSLDSIPLKRKKHSKLIESVESDNSDEEGSEL